jgi:hypothetical protein
MRNNGSWFWMPGVIMFAILVGVLAGCGQKAEQPTRASSNPDSIVIATIKVVYGKHMQLPTCWDSISVALPRDFVDAPSHTMYNGYTWTDQVNSPDFRRIMAVTTREYMYRPLYDQNGIYGFELYCTTGQAVYEVYNGYVGRMSTLFIIHRIRDLAAS